jgi:hypothetical protein
VVAARGINIKFMEDIYQDELRGYKRDTGKFRRRNYERHCKNKGIQPLSRGRKDLTQVALAIAATPLAAQAFV